MAVFLTAHVAGFVALEQSKGPSSGRTECLPLLHPIVENVNASLSCSGLLRHSRGDLFYLVPGAIGFYNTRHMLWQ